MQIFVIESMVEKDQNPCKVHINPLDDDVPPPTSGIILLSLEFFAILWQWRQQHHLFKNATKNFNLVTASKKLESQENWRDKFDIAFL